VSDSPHAASGASEALVTLAEVRLATAWNVRGNPAQAAFVAEAERALGIPLPLQPNTSTRNTAGAVFSLGPRAWLYVAGADFPRDDFDDVRQKLNGAGGALFDVSASYVAWSIAGANARTVLNRGCPLDFRERSFPRGHCAQSTLGHVNALFYRPADAPAYVVMVARSLARDAWHALTATTAHQMGPAVTFSMSAPGSATAG
jgi:sarcosine oxidase subunit gamma